MIALPCRVARLFFALLRRTAVARPRDAPPFVLLRQGSDGLSVSAWRGEVGLRWHRPGTSDPAAVAFTADHLAAFTGAADVTVTAIGPGRGEARWADRDGEHVRPLPTVEPDRVGLLPEPAGRTASLSASFLGAGGDPARMVAALGGALVREDRNFHTIQCVEVAAAQHRLLEGDEARLPLVAAARYLAAHATTTRAQRQTYEIARRLHHGENLFEDDPEAA